MEENVREKLSEQLDKLIKIGTTFSEKKSRLTQDQRREWAKFTAYSISLFDQLKRNSAVERASERFKEKQLEVLQDKYSQDINQLYKRILIDLFALGFSQTQAELEFKSRFPDIALTVDSMVKSAFASEDEFRDRVNQRKMEILREVESLDFLASLRKLQSELNAAKEELLARGEYKAYLTSLSYAMQLIEVFIKTVEKLKEEKVETPKHLNESNYFALTSLEEEGIIEIKKKEELKKLFGLDPNFEITTH